MQRNNGLPAGGCCLRCCRCSRCSRRCRRRRCGNRRHLHRFAGSAVQRCAACVRHGLDLEQIGRAVFERTDHGGGVVGRGNLEEGFCAFTHAVDLILLCAGHCVPFDRDLGVAGGRGHVFRRGGKDPEFQGLFAAVVALEGHRHGVNAGGLASVGVGNGIGFVLLERFAVCVCDRHLGVLHLAVFGVFGLGKADLCDLCDRVGHLFAAGRAGEGL